MATAGDMELDVARAPRVFVSYAHESREHEQSVLEFYEFLRSVGVDARIDVLAAQRPQEWNQWMLGELRAADFVLVIASPEYRRRADGEAPASEGRGVRFEAGIVQDEFYADRAAARGRDLAVGDELREVLVVVFRRGP